MSLEKDLKRTTKILDAVLEHLNIEIRTKPCNICHERGHLQDGGDCFKCDGYGEIIYAQ